MRYRIEFADGERCRFVESRDDLLKWLKYPHEGIVTDIRKVYSSGVSDSVMEKYRQFVNNPEPYEQEYERRKGAR